MIFGTQPSIHYIYIYSRICIQAEKVGFLKRLKEAKKVENDLRAKLQEKHTLLETAQRLIDREQEVAKMLRKDILSRDDELADLKDLLKEQTERTAEVESLLQQRQISLETLQEKLDGKLEDEQKRSCVLFRCTYHFFFCFSPASVYFEACLSTVLARLEAQEAQFQQFELDKKALEQKLMQSQVFRCSIRDD